MHEHSSTFVFYLNILGTLTSVIVGIGYAGFIYYSPLQYGMLFYGTYLLYM